MLRRTFLALVSAAVARAQQVIRSESRLVIVPTVVLNEKGAHVPGLTTGDFQLLDDGTPRAIRVDTPDTGVAPVSLIVAVQCAQLSAAVLAKIHKIGAMIQPLVVGDRGEAALIAFDDDLHIVQDFTSDPDAIADAFARVKSGAPEPSGRMLDAVELAAKMFAEREPNRRRVLLIVSESRDRGSRLKIECAVQLVQQGGIEVYAATYSAYATAFTAKSSDLPPPDYGGDSVPLIPLIFEGAREAKKKAAEILAAETGGAHFSFLKQRGLDQVITSAGADLHSQYVISFTPPADAAPGLHHIEIRVKGGAKYQIRARRACWVE